MLIATFIDMEDSYYRNGMDYIMHQIYANTDNMEINYPVESIMLVDVKISCVLIAAVSWQIVFFFRKYEIDEMA